jgi:hypothetical protein
MKAQPKDWALNYRSKRPSCGVRPSDKQASARSVNPAEGARVFLRRRSDASYGVGCGVCETRIQKDALQLYEIPSELKIKNGCSSGSLRTFLACLSEKSRSQQSPLMIPCA